MRTTKVNSKVVRAIKVPNRDTRPVRGSDVCPECYANIAILAKKNSGKTSIINKLLRECAGKNGRTCVMAFVSTLEKDAQWQVIKEWCENNNIPFLGYTSMMSGKHNILEAFVKTLQNEGKSEDSDGEGDAALRAPCGDATCAASPVTALLLFAAGSEQAVRNINPDRIMVAIVVRIYTSSSISYNPAHV